MAKKMLIDATHAEETRVVVVDGNKVEEFDFESENKRQLAGNIYLAKVTRVEPSLQAAFVDYGGNRHGFLAFSEIHPDYYQIPFEDRQKLIQEEEKEAEAVEDEDEEDAESAEGEAESGAEAGAEEAEAEEEAAEIAEQAAKRRRRALRSYKIQEVIKRRQVLLVQVVKEERGNKGAALTTYLSLAGRYCVLMPNTSRGGGISRKISDNADRKRLKEVVESLNLAEGMGVIIRTAGFSRTKAEIKRDYEYLLRLWERIREETLKSAAPALIYEEGNLIKRAIRDLYDKDFESILVEGDEAYRQAKDFMRVLIPSHAKKVQPYKDRIPLFMRQQVETQIDQIYQPVVQLKSGGYLVINQTEALVAIDVNSGRSTRERNIEATALKTNLEAADEACRQMRLRDLAGLIVIDFIDMEENKNNRAVEKRMRDALKADRSRIQIGKISQFGLLEMSRQRRRASVFEGSTEVCPHCAGTGFVRSSRSAALHVLRALEEEALKKRSALVRVKTPGEVALYLLNEKRGELQLFESQFGMCAHIEVDPSLTPPDFKLERLEALSAKDAEADEPEEATDANASDSGDSSEGSGSGGGRRRRRRRGRRSSEDRANEETNTASEESNDAEDEADADSASEAGADSGDDTDSDGQPKRKRRRRGRRGGRGRRRREGDADASSDSNSDGDSEDDSDDSQAEGMEVVEPQQDEALTATDTSKPEAEAEADDAESEPEAEAPEAEAEESREDPDAGDREEAEAEAEEAAAEDAAEEVEEADAEPEPAAEAEVIDFPETATAAPEPAPAEDKPKQPAKRGWWQKRGAD